MPVNKIKVTMQGIRTRRLMECYGSMRKVDLFDLGYHFRRGRTPEYAEFYA
jgi:hypothetical protein